MRDFAKDREICEAVMEGPWEVSAMPAECGPPHDGRGFCKLVISAPAGAKIQGVLLETPPRYTEFETVDLPIVVFVTEARTGWPAALDRIAELEAEVAKWRHLYESQHMPRHEGFVPEFRDQ